MSRIDEILDQGRKPRETITLLAEVLKEDHGLLEELVNSFGSDSTVKKGNCMGAIEHVTREDPAFAAGCIDLVIEHLEDSGPRVRREAARVIANVAGTFPERAGEAIPALLVNTEDSGTVVRWSAARALTGIARSVPGVRIELTPTFREIQGREENNGVRKIYRAYLEEVGEEAFIPALRKDL